ncbi:MAG: M23 family metallopeptidase [Bacteroidales bacterium]|nr:M23 family metallopeptidase [Bacteroidales bacterium]
MRLNTKIFFTIILLTFSVGKLRSQDTYPQDYFKLPMDIPIILSGSFGELRSNHFHTGLDIKTQGVVGKQILAPADGYISRIKVSPWGYGNALYITHPNGYMTVYAHLNNYNDELSKLIKQAQYNQKKFAVEIFPKKGSINIKQGDIIGYTGNSGSSGGPHLHFEIRNAKQEPINPLLFGIKVNDNKYPEMKKLRIYSYYKYDNSIYQTFSLYQKNAKVYKKYNDTIIITSNQFYPAVEGYDRFDGANNKNGYYKLEFYLDDSLYSKFTADKVNFNEKRYINSFIDYNAYKTTKQRFQRSYKEENAKLSNITDVVNNGIMHLTDNKAHKVKIMAYDFAGQISTLEVYIKSIGGDKHKEILNANIFEWNHENIYKTSDFELILPKNAFYSNQEFYAKSEDSKYSKYSQLCNIYKIGVPLHKHYKLKIKLNKPNEIANKSKLCIISLNNMNQIIYEGGSYSDGWINIKTRSFGKYYIDIDTIAPILTAKNIYNNKNITKQHAISFKVTDNLSGIKSYKASIDGEWVLLEYDPKRNHLYYVIDDRFKAGKHKFKITATDDRSNKTTLDYTLIRN